MKFSTKGRYGLRAMIEIADAVGEGPISIHTIAERQELSSRYLEQLLTPLKQAGLVDSIRGAHGGYVLGKDAKDITAGDIIRVLEGPISPVACTNESRPDKCERYKTCVTRKIWEEVKEAITDIIDSYTLDDLVRESRLDDD